MFMKFDDLPIGWQTFWVIMCAAALAIAANLIIDVGAAAHDLLCPEHGGLFK